ncbi:MAG: ABC transporter ATP-binding protein [Saprospiraceae bacterium]|nr:ABC transporter ATP-binding protein [Saprospiraceae bacterium]
MDLVLDNISKLYSDKWIFRGLNYKIDSGQKIAIRGHNGSGKTTLLSIISGLTLPSKGTITYWNNDQIINKDSAPLKMSFAAPYMSIFEELTGPEYVKHIKKFRPLRENTTTRDVLEIANLWIDRNKSIGQYSTGMVQRLRLIMAFMMKSEIIILDEPGSNLDSKSKSWFKELIRELRDDRTLIIASNDASDLNSCDSSIDLSQYN